MARILCIDDDLDIQQSCRMILEAVGHEVQTASNGTDGVKKAQEWQPEVIVLDVMMTNDTEGFHVAYTLRQDAMLKNVPILMLTSINEKSGMKFDPQKDGEFLPVDLFIDKPISPQVLTESVAKLLATPKDQLNIEGRTHLV